MQRHLSINVKGIVQGVGFRPYVYNLAVSLGLSGYVLNDSQGVTIEVQGNAPLLHQFLSALQTSPPPLSSINKIDQQWSDHLISYDGFSIKQSNRKGPRQVFISPDVATCPDCLREMNSPEDSRYHYPFINCTNCGPRFTIIRDVPYDRKNTTMSDFPLCPFCQGEYEDPSNRRFHAQPVACPICGPRVYLLDRIGNNLEQDPSRVIPRAAFFLRHDQVIAIKGLGGYHLAVDATSDVAVAKLRQRKARLGKPFAVMTRDLENARQYCKVNESEAALLASVRSPIVLLEKLENTDLASEVAPNNRYLGVMLAYTPLHHLLLDSFSGLLVMTSGNFSDEPVAYKDEDARIRLSNVADYFLCHNRPIHVRCDDTVTRIILKKEYPLRRSRGYAPEPINMPFSTDIPILAVGGHQKNTFCLMKGNRAILSHHIGNLDNPLSIASFKEGIEHFSRILDTFPKVIAHDLHPDYASTVFALHQEDVRLIPVQHHHAHICSVLADHGRSDRVIGITIDGSGFGSDSKSWGFEIMSADLRSYQRLSHLDFIPLPGGEAAIREPWRVAVSYLFKLMNRKLLDLDIPLISDIPEDKINFIIHMLEHNLSCPLASSGGRLFDAISSILGVRHFTSYEGQAAIDLEMIAIPNATGVYNYSICNTDSSSFIDVLPMFKGILKDLCYKVPREVIAGKFHNTISNVIQNRAQSAREKTGISVVTLSGGVFQNLMLLNKTINSLKEKGFEVLINKKVPTNDGGLSLGQAAFASAFLSHEH